MRRGRVGQPAKREEREREAERWRDREMVSMCVELLPRRCCRWREEENVMRILHLPLVVFVDTQPPEERVAHNPRVCVRRRPLCVLQLALQWRHTPRGGVRRIQTTCRRGRRGVGSEGFRRRAAGDAGEDVFTGGPMLVWARHPVDVTWGGSRDTSWTGEACASLTWISA